MLEVHGISEPISRVKAAMTGGNKEFDIDKHTGLLAHEFYTEWNMIELKHLGIIEKAKARKLAEEIDLEWFEHAQIFVYPDVMETLCALKRMRLRLGVVTGGYEGDIEKILPKVGLKKFFDVCVGVDTVGKRKPHPAAFQYALEKLNVKAEEAIFVGDDYRSDYLGAREVGMIPVLICRDGLPASGVRAIEGLNDIFEVISEADN